MGADCHKQEICSSREQGVHCLGSSQKCEGCSGKYWCLGTQSSKWPWSGKTSPWNLQKGTLSSQLILSCIITPRGPKILRKAWHCPFVQSIFMSIERRQKWFLRGIRFPWKKYSEHFVYESYQFLVGGLAWGNLSLGWTWLCGLASWKEVRMTSWSD